MSSPARRNPTCPRCLDPITFNKVRRRGGYEPVKAYHPECWKDERREREQNAILAFWVFSPKTEVDYDNPSDHHVHMDSGKAEPRENQDNR